MSTDCTFHLLSLKPGTSPAEFVALLRKSSLRPYLEGRVSGWAVAPTHLSPGGLVLQTRWDMALLIGREEPIPPAWLEHVESSWRLEASFPSEMLAGLGDVNLKLLFPGKNEVPSLSQEWCQGERPPAHCITQPASDSSVGEISITPERAAWMREHGKKPEGNEAVTMLNLMAYEPVQGKEKMAGYSAAFLSAFASEYGTTAKLFGKVESYDRSTNDMAACGYGWDACALVHYPSIWHFGSIVSSPKYAEIEHKHRKGAMRDVGILCISETGLLHATQ